MPDRSPHVVDLDGALAGKHRTSEESKDAAVDRLPRQAVDLLATIGLKVGDMARSRVEKDGPLQLHDSLEGGDGPIRSEIGFDASDEGAVGEQGDGTLGSVITRDVESCEEGDQDVDGRAVADGSRRELTDEQLDVVLGHVRTGTDEKQELADKPPLFLVPLYAHLGDLVGERRCLAGRNDRSYRRRRTAQRAPQFVGLGFRVVERLDNLFNPGALCLAGTRTTERDFGPSPPRQLFDLAFEYPLDARRDDPLVGRECAAPDGMEA